MKRILVGVAFGVLAACATAGGPLRESPADARLRAIYEAEWAWRTPLDPDADEESSDDETAPRIWSKVDPASQAERHAYM